MRKSRSQRRLSLGELSVHPEVASIANSNLARPTEGWVQSQEIPLTARHSDQVFAFNGTSAASVPEPPASIRRQRSGLDSSGHGSQYSSVQNSDRTRRTRRGGGGSYNEYSLTPVDLPARRTHSNHSVTPRHGGSADNSSANVGGFSENQLILDRKVARANYKGPSIENIRGFSNDFGFQLFANLHGPTLLTKNIMLGGRDDVSSLSLLLKYGVTHILNVAAQLPNYHENLFVYLKLPIIDSPDVNILSYMSAVCGYLSHIEEINGRVFVHCISGVSRSVTVIILYLIMHHKIELIDAYKYIKHHRPYISPNDGFKLQMATTEINELGFSSIKSKQAGKEWDFYALNIKKDSFPEKPKGGRQSSNRQLSKSNLNSITKNEGRNEEDEDNYKLNNVDINDPACCLIS